jgi:CHAT domain-containing protein/tetratricopeptide (TPR) repeat protein
MATRRKILDSRTAILTFLFLLAGLLALTTRPNLAVAKSATELTATGHQLLASDQPQAAIHTWRQALELYKRQQNREGEIGTRLNISNAEQALQRFDLACNTLYAAYAPIIKTNFCQPTTQPTEIANLPERLSHQPLVLPVLENLGQVYLQLGRVDLGQALLQDLHQRYPQADGVTLNLANAYGWQVRQAIARYQATQDAQAHLAQTVSVQKSMDAAFRHYHSLTASGNPWIRSQAPLNELGLLTQISTWFSRPPEIILDRVRLNQLIDLCNQPNPDLPPTPIWQQKLQLATHLADLNSSNKVAVDLAQGLYNQAKSQQSPRRIAQSGLVLSQLYLQSNQLAPVESTLNLSLNQARQSGDSGLIFAAEWALAQFYERQGNSEQELTRLRAAVSVAEQMRVTYLWTNSAIQNGFNTTVEPAYRKLFSTLLDQPNPDIAKSLQIFETLRQSQLESYLGCGRLGLQSLSNILSQQTEKPSLVYLIGSEKKLNIIFQAPNGSYSLHRAPVADVKSHLSSLLQNLQAEDARAIPESIIRRDSAPLYDLLIRPYSSQIPDRGTIVFVLDNELQGLPLGTLHNGKKYLIEEHPIALSTPQSRQPKRLGANQMQILVGGIDQRSPSFESSGLNPLPGVGNEINAIQDIFRRHIILRNTSFTAAALKQSAQRGLPIIHIATHGVFAGEPDKTVLFSWDKAISVRQIQEVFRTAAKTSLESNLEMLVLTGCELARGDRDAGLGLAGIGIQSGARSTLASIWQVDDASTAPFVRSFYKAISTGKTKAEALQLAQLDLMATAEYSHPCYWGGWLLLGSRL